MQSGGGCFWRSHHFATGASSCNVANELSRRTHKRFRFESRDENRPTTAEPNRRMLSMFAPAASRMRVTNSLIFSLYRQEPLHPRFATSCCWRHRLRNCPPQSRQSLHHRRSRPLRRTRLHHRPILRLYILHLALRISGRTAAKTRDCVDGVTRMITTMMTSRMMPPMDIPPLGVGAYCVGARGCESVS